MSEYFSVEIFLWNKLILTRSVFSFIKINGYLKIATSTRHPVADAAKVIFKKSFLEFSECLLPKLSKTNVAWVHFLKTFRKYCKCSLLNGTIFWDLFLLQLLLTAYDLFCAKLFVKPVKVYPIYFHFTNKWPGMFNMGT